jgi:hypothetical protein
MIRLTVVTIVLPLLLNACMAQSNQPEVSSVSEDQPASIRAGIFPWFYSSHPRVKRPVRIVPPVESSAITAAGASRPAPRGLEATRNPTLDEPEPSIKAIDEAAEALDRVQRKLINTPKLD